MSNHIAESLAFSREGELNSKNELLTNKSYSQEQQIAYLEAKVVTLMERVAELEAILGEKA